jgi:two-component sensor histidine kinase
MNAIKHGFPGGAEGEIHVSFGPAENKFLLSVTDDGVGLPNEQAAAEAVPAGSGFSGGGAGLGMRLIEAFTQQAGGELQFERNRKGARFEIWLPKEVFIESDLTPGSTPARVAHGK